jgi:concanavalin A-like lectin/glucanase superfamily protein/fibronectin type III domain protein/lysyl oxidase
LLARALLLLTLTSVALLAASPAHAGIPLYPDLQTLPPHELDLDRTDVSADGSGVMHNVLRFSNTTWNNGEGRAEIRAQIDPVTKEGPAVERVQDTDGNFAEYPVGRLYYHAAHDHYHFDDWGEYQLWTRAAYDSWEASGRAIGNAVFIGSKTTSCMMDVEIVGNLPNTPYPSQFPGTGCGAPNSQGLIVEGLSVGWGDTYESSRSEQWIDLDQQTLPDGDYVLRSVADPNNRVYESPAKGDPARESAADNESILPFTIAGGQIADSNPPEAPTVVVNDVAEETTSPNVTVAVRGRDDVSGIDQFRLSNDGNQWKTFTYTTGGLTASTKVSWNLADPAYGGTAAGGSHTVYAQVHDRAGNWSTVGTDAIGLHNGSSGTSYAAAVQADSPTGWWRLGETSGSAAGDSAGSDPGTYRNGVTLGQAGLLSSDPANGAAAFDGVNDHVNVPDATAVSPAGSFSLEAWIKPASIPPAGSFRSVATKEGSYSLQFNGPRLEFTIVQAGTRRRAQAPAGAVVAGQTYHVVGTYNGSFSRLYVNGNEVASLSVSGGATVTASPLTIGAWSATDEFMDGTIDEAALYGVALSGARVLAHHAAGTTGLPDPVPAPGNLNATASAGRIDLTWTDNSTNETEFVLERDTDSGFAAPTTVTLGANTTSYPDTGLATGRKYYYRVKARNTVDTSGWSNVTSATTPDPVDAPSQLAAVAASPTKADLTWLDNSTNETEFVLERDTTTAFSSPTAFTLPANTSAYSDTTVAGATTYHYRLRARNDSDTSPNSNVATVTTPAPPLAAPTALGATAASDTRIDLSWTDNSVGETSFVVERDTSPSFTSPATLSAPANATTLADTGLAAATTYHYRVRARNATESSPNSNPASATTQSAPPPPPAYPEAVRADGPVAHWRLGETSGTAAADAMSAHPGAYVNAPTLGSPSLLGAEPGNRSATFDGAIDHVRVPDATALKLSSPFTLEAWIKPAAIPAAGSFASVVTKGSSYSLQFNGPRLEFTVIQSGARRRLQAPAGAVVAGQAYHVVGTYDGATRRLYLNGTQVASGALTGPATASTYPLAIASWDGREEFYRGTVDEVAVYRSALPAARVSAHWNAGK